MRCWPRWRASRRRSWDRRSTVSLPPGLLFRQGAPPHATYLFKHALVQDAAYGTLLREPRRALHARIAEALESQFAEIAENQPELLARHCTEAGLIEKAAGLWGKAGQRSLARSALVEAVAQLTRALAQIAALPATPALRREQIKLQVALITPLMHVKGYAAPETKAAVGAGASVDRTSRSDGRASRRPAAVVLGPLRLLGRELSSRSTATLMRELAAQFLTLAEKQGATVPLMIGHRIMGISLMFTGDIAEGRAHYDQALALYDPAEHRPLATRFGIDVRVAALSYRSSALWLLGYPEAALADADHALDDAREIGQAATLMYALALHIVPTSYAETTRRQTPSSTNLSLWRTKKAPSFWKAVGMLHARLRFCPDRQSRGRSPNDHLRASTAWRSTGATLLDAVVFVTFGAGPMRNSANSMTPGAASTKR